MRKIVYILFIPALLAGCSRFGSYYHVAQGARAYANGDYQRANIAYIEASGSEDNALQIAFNLGTVYYALGEVSAAESEWQIAEGTADQELAYRVFFNYGVLLFERGEYAEAYEKFRNALEIEPTGIEAKINLELTMEKMEVRKGESQALISPQAPREGRAEVELIMNYLKKMEGEVWESTEVLEYEPLPRDL